MVEDGVPQAHFDPSYYTGIPNSAPPSFRSRASTVSSRAPLPPAYYHHQPAQRTATSISQQSTAGPDAGADEDAESVVEDPGISLWGGSSVMDTTDSVSVRENMIAQLLNRIERLESRLEDAPLASKEVDLEAQKKARRKALCITIGVTIGVVVFALWFMAVILLSIYARVEIARHAGLVKDNSLKD
ncbi:hypothetical protein BP5796_11515 [Coleophoma crateriformis]|uniref:Uncharacterized protein n=1 Tax=Coleophoma crateriformis TaxID=565419 RepID=A0A3D8QIG1_9HELO|nr:hypothetical protein BP5796_11515 [Coleophoma crateriformis]